MQTIKLPSKPPTSPHPVLNLSFRIFFLGAGIFAIISMLKWSHIIFATDFAFNTGTDLLPFYWHGHEMVYGYGLAVIAGFLLTAVKTWTNQPMPYGWKLLIIFLPWLFARLIFLINGIHVNIFMMIACGLDLLFWALVMFFVIKPILLVQQIRQLGIVGKLLLIFYGHGSFYYTIFHGQDYIVTQATLLFGFYLIIGIVLIIGRRVVPMFIERGIYPNGTVAKQVKNSIWLDRLNFIGFFCFMLVDVFFKHVTSYAYLLTMTALLVAIVNLWRLKNWHLAEIWSRPLLWSLWLSFMGIAIGFLLFAVQPWLNFNHSLAFHAVALSGIGLLTLSMMSRVALGHTGRSIHHPPKLVVGIFICMILAWLARVGLPFLLPEYYLLTVAISQGFWLLAFFIFCLTYFKILVTTREDGLFG